MPEIEHELNLCDTHIVNKFATTQHHELLYNADDIKVLNMDLKVNSMFTKWAELTHRSDNLGYEKVFREKKDDCMGITMQHATRGAFNVSMTNCAGAMK